MGLRRIHGSAWATRSLWVCAVRLGSGERVVFGRGATPAVALPHEQPALRVELAALAG